MSNFSKEQIKRIAKKCFILGKEDTQERVFDEYFEKYYEENTTNGRQTKA